jgi:hypothetical protein
VTAATGGFTVIDAVPMIPSHVAVIVAMEVLLTEGMGVSMPVLETAAIVVSDDDHTTGKPVTVLPFGSAVVAVNCSGAPEKPCGPISKLEAAGRITTEATEPTSPGPTTVIAAVALTPPLDTVIVVLPGATAVTRPPEAVTVATAVFDEDHVSGMPWRAPPFSSSGVTVSESDAPDAIVTAD